MKNVSERLFECFKSSDPAEQLAELEMLREAAEEFERQFCQGRPQNPATLKALGIEL